MICYSLEGWNGVGGRFKREGTYVCRAVRLCAAPWTIAHQVPLSMGFSRQECWSGLPCLPQGALGVAGGFFTFSATWEAWTYVYLWLIHVDI